MPIDYKLYPKNWKSEIRPAILARAENCCEFCRVPNGIAILRGTWNDTECYQDMDGAIFNANTGDLLGDDYIGEVHPTNNLIKVVLTVAHMDHDITNNDHKNLMALCQQCHNRYDIENRKKKRGNKKQLKLF